jgi:hypothetical protein
MEINTDLLNLTIHTAAELQDDACEPTTLYPNTASYKAEEFTPLPPEAKGRSDENDCAALQEVDTTPNILATDPPNPQDCSCVEVPMNGPYVDSSPVIKCRGCLDVYKSLDTNSCPVGSKLFSPQSRQDWETFLGCADPFNTEHGIMSPHFIIDITCPESDCAVPGDNSVNQAIDEPRARWRWTTSDGSPWWLRDSWTPIEGSATNYDANCYIGLTFGDSATADTLTFAESGCDYHSSSYYCQVEQVSLIPGATSPTSCVCKKIALNGAYSAGFLVKCEKCLDVYKSSQANSCPSGMKIWSPRTKDDWKTFIASATALYNPHWIVDVTRDDDGCGEGCTTAEMNSGVPAQATWHTDDGSPWFLRDTIYQEPNGDYQANCYMDLVSHPANEDGVVFRDHECNVHSRSYYCQSRMTTTTTTIATCATYDCETAGWVKKSGVDALIDPTDAVCCEGTCTSHTCTSVCCGETCEKLAGVDTLINPTDAICCETEPEVCPTPIVDNWASAYAGSGYAGITAVRAQTWTQWDSAGYFEVEYPIVTLSGSNNDGTWAMHGGCGNVNGEDGCDAICQALGSAGRRSGWDVACGTGYPDGAAAFTATCVMKDGSNGIGSETDDWVADYGTVAECVNPMEHCQCQGTMPNHISTAVPSQVWSTGGNSWLIYTTRDMAAGYTSIDSNAGFTSEWSTLESGAAMTMELMFRKEAGTDCANTILMHSYCETGNINTNRFSSSNRRRNFGISCSTGGSYHDGNWHRFVWTAVKNPSNSAQTTVYYYIDGVSVGGGDNLDSPLGMSADGQICIGGGHLDRMASYEIARVGIWNRELSASEITGSSTTCLSSTSGLVAYYPLDGDFHDVLGGRDLDPGWSNGASSRSLVGQFVSTTGFPDCAAGQEAACGDGYAYCGDGSTGYDSLISGLPSGEVPDIYCQGPSRLIDNAQSNDAACLAVCTGISNCNVAVTIDTGSQVECYGFESCSGGTKPDSTTDSRTIRWYRKTSSTENCPNDYNGNADNGVAPGDNVGRSCST